MIFLIFTVSISTENYNKRMFLDDLRKAIRLKKNIHYKNEHMKRQGIEETDNSFLLI